LENKAVFKVMRQFLQLSNQRVVVVVRHEQAATKTAALQPGRAVRVQVR
jgi:hypothetical protein